MAAVLEPAACARPERRATSRAGRAARPLRAAGPSLALVSTLAMLASWAGGASAEMLDVTSFIAQDLPMPEAPISFAIPDFAAFSLVEEQVSFPELISLPGIPSVTSLFSIISIVSVPSIVELEVPAISQPPSVAITLIEEEFELLSVLSLQQQFFPVSFGIEVASLPLSLPAKLFSLPVSFVGAVPAQLSFEDAVILPTSVVSFVPAVEAPVSVPISLPDVPELLSPPSPPPPPPSDCVYGCTDPTHILYDPGATCERPGEECVPLIFGCTFVHATNYNSRANVEDGSCFIGVEGCTDPTKLGYSPTANISRNASEDGYCYELIEGCTHPFSSTYNSLATQTDLSNFSTICLFEIEGCYDPAAYNYWSSANSGNQTELCVYWTSGCNVPVASNYGSNVDTYLNNSCTFIVAGCMDSTAWNYYPDANSDEGVVCIPTVRGCMDPNSAAYLSTANTDDGSCVYDRPGCMDPTAINYNSFATVADGSCIATVEGCLVPGFLEYDPNANQQVEGACVTAKVYGCMDSTAANYNADATFGADAWAEDYPMLNQTLHVCVPAIYGCMAEQAINYNSAATSPGSAAGPGEPCLFMYPNGTIPPNATLDDTFDRVPGGVGCSNPAAANYDSLATIVADDQCIFVGCTLTTSPNYDSAATARADADSGLPCALPVYGCTNSEAINYQPSATEDSGDCVVVLPPPIVYGCLDSTAVNYNSLADADASAFALAYPTLDSSVYVCVPAIYGCMAEQAINYNSAATSPGSVDGPGEPCLYVYPEGAEIPSEAFNDTFDRILGGVGCTIPTAINFDSLATIVANDQCLYAGCTDPNSPDFDSSATVQADAGVPCAVPVYGCTNPEAYNYFSGATADSGECLVLAEPYALGCQDPAALNYDSDVMFPENSRCVYPIPGCTDSRAFNFLAEAGIDDGTCVFAGCMDPDSPSYDLSATASSTCEANLLGCTDRTAVNYVPSANVDDGTCFFVMCIEIIPNQCLTCTPDYVNYVADPPPNTVNGFCESIQVACIDPAALNYDTEGNTPAPEGYCAYGGCLFPTFLNYDSSATVNGGCVSEIFGCNDPRSDRYDVRVNAPDATEKREFFCTYPDCTLEGAFNYNASANIGCVNQSCCIAFSTGCMDPAAADYKSQANKEGVCERSIDGLPFQLVGFIMEGLLDVWLTDVRQLEFRQKLADFFGIDIVFVRFTGEITEAYGGRRQLGASAAVEQLAAADGALGDGSGERRALQVDLGNNATDAVDLTMRLVTPDGSNEIDFLAILTEYSNPELTQILGFTVIRVYAGAAPPPSPPGDALVISWLVEGSIDPDFMQASGNPYAFRVGLQNFTDLPETPGEDIPLSMVTIDKVYDTGSAPDGFAYPQNSYWVDTRVFVPNAYTGRLAVRIREVEPLTKWKPIVGRNIIRIYMLNAPPHPPPMPPPLPPSPPSPPPSPPKPPPVGTGGSGGGGGGGGDDDTTTNSRVGGVGTNVDTSSLPSWVIPLVASLAGLLLLLCCGIYFFRRWKRVERSQVAPEAGGERARVDVPREEDDAAAPVPPPQPAASSGQVLPVDTAAASSAKPDPPLPPPAPPPEPPQQAVGGTGQVTPMTSAAAANRDRVGMVPQID